MEVLSLSPKRRPRRHFSVPEKQHILNVFKACQQEHPDFTKSEAVEFTSKVSGAGISSVYKIMREYYTFNGFVPPKPYHRARAILDNVDEETKAAIRQKVDSLKSRNEPPTIQRVLVNVNQDQNLQHFKKSTLRKLLKEIRGESTVRSQPSTSSSSPSIDPFKEEPSCSREEEPGFAPTLELLPEQADQPHLDMATRSFKGSKDKMYCRLCLKPAYKNSLTPLSVVDFNYPGKNDAFKKKKREKVEEINKMLRFCLPFFNSLTFNPIICSICLGRLKIAYEFSKECLKSQRLIEKYAETYGTTEKVINLNEMIETKFELFNEENISDTETTVSGIPKVTRSNARVSSKRQYSNEDSPPAKKLKDYHETHEEDSLSSSNDDTSNIKIEPDDDDSCALTKSVKTEPDEDDSAYMERVIQDVPKDYIIDPNKSDDETTIKVEPNYFDTPDFIKSEPVDELQVESKLFNERTGIGTVIAGEDSEFHEMENVPLNTTKAPLFARGTVFPHVGSSLEDTTSDVIK